MCRLQRFAHIKVSRVVEFIKKQINFTKNLFSFSLLSILEYLIQIFTHLLYKTPFMNRALSKFELEPKHNCYIGTMRVNAYCHFFQQAHTYFMQTYMRFFISTINLDWIVLGCHFKMSTVHWLSIQPV